MKWEPVAHMWKSTLEINIQTGESRYRKYLFGQMVSESVSATHISKAISGPIDETDIRDWHFVTTSDLSLNPSPHYRFHSAQFQLGLFADLIDEPSGYYDQRKDIAETILRLWQETGNDFEAGRYILSLQQAIPSSSN